jgi:hypothetical protein
MFSWDKSVLAVSATIARLFWKREQLVNRSKIEAKNNNELIFNNRRSLSTSILLF